MKESTIRDKLKRCSRENKNPWFKECYGPLEDAFQAQFPPITTLPKKGPGLSKAAILETYYQKELFAAAAAAAEVFKSNFERAAFKNKEAAFRAACQASVAHINRTILDDKKFAMAYESWNMSRLQEVVTAPPLACCSSAAALGLLY